MCVHCDAGVVGTLRHRFWDCKAWNIIRNQETIIWIIATTPNLPRGTSRCGIITKGCQPAGAAHKYLQGMMVYIAEAATVAPLAEQQRRMAFSREGNHK